MKAIEKAEGSLVVVVKGVTAAESVALGQRSGSNLEDSRNEEP